MRPLNEQQRLFLVESTQLYAPWIQAQQHLDGYKYGMKWLTSKGHDYLYRLTDARGNGKSLGPRSPATETLFSDFVNGRARAKDRLNGLDDKIKMQARLNRAVHLDRLPIVASEILHAINKSKAREDFRLVGTHAIYAYESMAGAHLKMELLASGDIDLLYDHRKKLSLVSKHLEGNGLLGLLQKVDSSFEITKEETFRAVNRDGFMVDLIMPERDMRDTSKVQFAANDLEAVEIPNLHWLANSPCVESVIIASNGMPVNARVPDPRAFVIHKAWLSQEPSRDPVKKPRDYAQAKMVFELIQEYLPLHPFQPEKMRYLPMSVFKEFFGKVSQVDLPAPHANSQQTTQDRLRALVLAIDSTAIFVVPDPTNKASYIGKVAVALDDFNVGFAQRLGGGKYALHELAAPVNSDSSMIDVCYNNGEVKMTVEKVKDQDRGR